MKKLVILLCLTTSSAIAQAVINKPILCGDRESFKQLVEKEDYKTLSQAEISNRSYLSVWIGKRDTILVTETYPEGVCVVTGGRDLELNDTVIKEFYSRRAH